MQPLKYAQDQKGGPSPEIGPLESSALASHAGRKYATFEPHAGAVAMLDGVANPSRLDGYSLDGYRRIITFSIVSRWNGPAFTNADLRKIWCGKPEDCAALPIAH